MPKISIIIVNFNGKDLLKDCLDSILSQTYREFEIIVVDNGSEDGSSQFIAETFPVVRLFAIDHNVGFTGGNIEGLRHARGEFIVLQNNDAVLVPDWLETMRAAMDSDEKIGFCSSRIVISGTQLVDSAGDTFTTAFSGTKMGEMQDKDNFSQRKFVPGACAAAVIYRRAMLDDIGFLDDDFFLNHEDTDLNLRAWLAGWKCLFVPEALVYHRVSTTLGKFSDLSVYYFARNSLWVWIKNAPVWFMVYYFPQRILYEMASFFFFCLISKKWKPFLKGKRDSLLGVARMWRKRQIVQAKIRLSRNEIQSELIPLRFYLAEKLRLRRCQGK